MNESEWRDTFVAFAEMMRARDILPQKDFDSVVQKCLARISGPGKSQYYNPETQTWLFETMPIGSLLEFAREENYDEFVYAAMLHVRLVGPPSGNRIWDHGTKAYLIDALVGHVLVSLGYVNELADRVSEPDHAEQDT